MTEKETELIAATMNYRKATRTRDLAKVEDATRLLLRACDEYVPRSLTPDKLLCSKLADEAAKLQKTASEMIYYAAVGDMHNLIDWPRVLQQHVDKMATLVNNAAEGRVIADPS